MPSASCICGKTSLTYSADQTQMTCVCHCLTCRKLTGSNHATGALVPLSAIIDTGVAPRVTHGTHETGMKFEFRGCENCPSTLYKLPDGYPGMGFMFLGVIDDEKEGVGQKPAVEMWTKYRVAWAKELEGTVQFEEFPPAN